MKNYKEIIEQINTLSTEYATLCNESDNMIHACGTAADLETRIATRRGFADRLNEIERRKQDITLEKRILVESFKAAFAVYAWDIIKPILEKYAGKQYGQKTKEKIQAAARDQGIGFYFDGYNNYSRINAYPLFDNYRVNSDFDVTLYAVDGGGHITAFIDSNNTIAETMPSVSNHYKYVDNIESRVNEIKAAFKLYETAAENLNKACDALKEIYPGFGSFDHYYTTRLV